MTQKRLGFFDLGWWKLRRLCSLVSGRGGLEQINFLHFLRAITRLVECLHRVRVDLGVGRGEGPSVSAVARGSGSAGSSQFGGTGNWKVATADTGTAPRQFTVVSEYLASFESSAGEVST